MTGTCMVGWAHTPFGKLPNADGESGSRPPSAP